MATDFQTLIIAIKTGNPYEVAEYIVKQYTNAEWFQIVDTVSKLHLYDMSYKKITQNVLANIPEAFPLPLLYFATPSFRGALISYLPANKLATFANVMFGGNSNKHTMPQWMFLIDDTFNFNLYIEIFHMLIGFAIQRKLTGIVYICISAVSTQPLLKNVVLSYYYTAIAENDLFDPLLISYFRSYDPYYKDKYLSKKQIAAVDAVYARAL